ncbi:hypothetical protein GWI33_016065 [Rhynchophorus ferrugineus]|uniref:Nose resistant to fluoxetine protein 6-like protein n=1 Tax=Rhynchophorus ferrugineus TaxID=354439 RepID=A0A834M926_RHYFE|nr:hypothetical protein GWI33_016065 [Rhynchophorus ferrugineus]
MKSTDLLVVLCLNVYHGVYALYFQNFLQIDVPRVNNSAVREFLSQNNFDMSNFYLVVMCSVRQDNDEVSEDCRNQMNIICNNSEILNPMADAWSKIPYTGMTVSTAMDLGTFDQCVDIDYYIDQTRILGKHCTYGWGLPIGDSTYVLSYCAPDKCSSSDLVRLITTDPNAIEILDKIFNDDRCQTKESRTSMNASEIVVACLFGLFLCLLILSTSYDIVMRRKKSKPDPLFVAFSAYSNGQKLFQTTSPSAVKADQILCFHGLKAVSMMWILAGHAVGLFSVVPLVNQEKLNEFNSELASFYITGAYFAVDTFFYLSGFLIAYQYFKSASEKKVVPQLIGIPQMIIHRYLRITPALLMMFLYGVYLAQFLSTGPLYGTVSESIARPCKEHWWAVFLYIQNYYNPTDLCYTHSWYLSTDWQLFLISPFVLIPVAMQYRRSFNTVMYQLLALNVFFIFLPLLTKLVFPDSDPNYLEYDTQSKLIDYFLGFTLGFYIRCKRHRKYIFDKITNLILWAISLTLMLGTLLIYQQFSLGSQHSHLIRSLSYTFTKPVWCIGLSFIIYSCVYGKGGFINSWLSNSCVQILSKLSYCMYLMHAPVIVFWLSTKRTREYFGHYNLFVLFGGHLVGTIIVAIIWSLAFESPLIKIEGLIFGTHRAPKPPPKNDDLPPKIADA